MNSEGFINIQNDTTVQAVNDPVSGELRLPSQDINADLAFFTRNLGFRLEQIYPADNPASILLSGYGLRLRLEKGSEVPAATLRLLCRHIDAKSPRQLTAPCGCAIELVEAEPELQTPHTQHEFVVRRLQDQAPWVIGRAGMHYRDLIPGRMGGSIIASHIRIPEGGPVPDMVHYHTVGFQLIYCYKGWVDVVYEDQGEPIRLTAGDCVTQPPQIRHRVLESGDQLEVIEIGVPAEHMTTIDHEMQLPTKTIDRRRQFDGQTFVHHQLGQARWQPWRVPGFECRDTGIAAGTDGVANVQVAKALSAGSTNKNDIRWVSHDCDILFSFVLQGSMELRSAERTHQLTVGDAFVIPPGDCVGYSGRSADLQLLEVSLPGKFNTTVHK